MHEIILSSLLLRQNYVPIMYTNLFLQLFYRPLSFIEDYIRTEVMPCYGNTHTTTSITSRQTTFFREEARLEMIFIM